MAFTDLPRVLTADCGLDSSAPLLLGFSGGPDSLALLHALRAAGRSLLVAHLDHGLRPESAEDARRAMRLVETYKLPFFTERADAAALAKEGGLSIEEAARTARYEFLFRVAGKQGAQAVAVAHNADDQAETILMHLLRGAGTAGLRGMSARLLPNPWSDSIPLVRPLLHASRAEILSYVAQHGLDPIIDPSNSDPVYFRNRLRHELLPILEDFAPGIRGRLQQSGELLAADHALIEKLAQEAWQRCLAQRGGGFVGFDRVAFLAEPLALQRALLRRATAHLRPSQRDVDFAAVERAIAAIHAHAPGQQDWIAGLSILVEPDRIWLAEWGADLPARWPQAAAQSIHLELPASVQLNNGWQLSLRDSNPDLELARKNADHYQAWMDADAVGEQLLLRRPLPGDRFQPLGMDSGSQKLSDFFTNEKMAARARVTWPLLFSGSQLAWVPGYRLAHPFRLRANSRRALHAQLILRS